jgi:IS30 family transposase
VGFSQKEVAAAIGVHPSTVGREIERNHKVDGGYHAWVAEVSARERRKESKKRYRKIENDPKLSKQIERMLHPLVSPEVVAHELSITHETIYAWIYRSRPDLKTRLPYRGKKRRRYGTKRVEKQGWTKDVRSIDERPLALSSFEGDTVVGSTKPRLLTHVERKSLFAVVDLLPSGEAGAVHEKMKENEVLHDSVLTYDRGSEFSLWRMIERDTDSKVFFAHAHHPWERGKNENTNGRLRRVFPKRFDFSTIKQKDVDQVVWLMNHTKRKSLNWRSPCRVFGKCCTSS